MRTLIRSKLALTALGLLGAASLFVAGCGAALPPKELLDARAAYKTATEGPAAKESLVELHGAKQALDSAELAFLEKGDGQETVDRSYIAVRKAEFASAAARTAVAAREKKEAEEEAQRAQIDALKKTQAELANAKNDLSATRTDLTKTKEALEREAAARAEAEKRAAMALADLQKIAAVKKDDRGMVITLSGGVLFRTDKADLLPPAMVQLNQVAEALVRNNPDARIQVEGHTDNQGQAARNDELSKQRAESVATYLKSRGIAADRVTAVGRGSSKPVADNTSVEGRALNRRVEIVVEPPKEPK